MFSRMKQVETESGFYSWLLNNLLTVPAATGNADFSVRRSNVQHEVKQLTDTAENTVERFFIDNRGDFDWGQRAVEAEEVCGETGNVRSSHGSPLLLFSPPTSAGGNDVHAGSPDVDGGTIVGFTPLCIIERRSGDGDHLLNAGRRVVARVLVIVSGRHDDGDTAVVKLKMKSPVSSFAAMFHPASAYPFNGLVHSHRTTSSTS